MSHQLKALTAAALAGHADIVHELLFDRRVFASPTRVHKAACAAAMQGRASVVEAFLVHPWFDASADGDSLLGAAAQSGDVAVVDLLLAHDTANAAGRRGDALRAAAQHGHWAVFLRLQADRRVRLAKNNCFHLSLAAEHGQLHIVEQLLVLAAGHEQEKDCFNDAILAASTNGHLAVLERLLGEDLADPSRGRALAAAAARGHLAIVERLLEDPRVSYSLYHTQPGDALCAAAQNGKLAIVEHLLADEGLYLSSDQRCRALEQASRAGHASVVARLLREPPKRGASLEGNAVFKALCSAARHGYLGIVDLLLADARVLNPREGAYDRRDPVCALTAAAEGGSTAVVRRLLADPRAELCVHFDNAVHAAVSGGHLDALDRLLTDSRAERLQLSDFHYEAWRHAEAVYRLLACPQAAQLTLHAAHDVRRCAAESGHTGLLDRLPVLESHAGLHLLVEELVKMAAGKGHAAVLERFLAETTTRLSSEPLCSAIQSGHGRIVEILLTSGRVDPSADGNAAIRCAARHGRAEIVDCLLAVPGVDPSVADNEAVRLAAASGSVAVVGRLLADPRVDPSAGDNAALVTACLRGHADVVERLLADPRVLSSRLDTALTAAAQGGHLHVLERLLRLSSSPVDLSAGLALSAAAANGHALVVQRLLADPRTDPSSDNNGPIRAGVSQHAAGAFAVVQQLLADPRVDPSVFDHEPLRKAVNYGQVGVARLLLDDARVDAALNEVSGLSLMRKALDGSHLSVGIADMLLATPSVRRCIRYLLPWRYNELTALLVGSRFRLCASQLAAFADNPGASSPTATAALRRMTDVSVLAAEAWRRRRAVVLARAIALEEL